MNLFMLLGVQMLTVEHNSDFKYISTKAPPQKKPPTKTKQKDKKANPKNKNKFEDFCFHEQLCNCFADFFRIMTV